MAKSVKSKKSLKLCMQAAKSERELKANEYQVMWTIPFPELQKVETAGSVVTVVNVIPGPRNVTVAGLSGNVENLVEIEGGTLPIPVQYLAPKRNVETDIEKKIRDLCPHSYRIARGCWWAGRISPVEAACILSDICCDIGSFVVCQPPEWQKEDNSWMEFCLLVRNCTGLIQMNIWEWREKEYFNARFDNLKKLTIAHDTLPDPPTGPPPTILYFPIRRTKQGEHYIGNKEDKKVFLTLEQLLTYYSGHLLPVAKPREKDDKIELVLQTAAMVNPEPFCHPRPLFYPRECPGYELPPLKLTLLKGLLPDIKLLGTRCSKLRMGDEADVSQTVRRAYFHCGGEYKQVVVRKMRQSMWRKKEFDADIKELVMVENTASASRRGMEYLAQLIAFGDDQAVGGPWIAYDGICGIALDRLFQKRRFDDWFISPRCQFEVIYQVAWAMRFLEANGLCHRHLRASNIVVEREEYDHMAIKVTDYMLPYHALRRSTVAEIELEGLDWPWWAPECHQTRTFDILTDIWSFGCCIFEIMNYGLPPYSFEDPKLTQPADIAKFYAAGNRMKTVEDNQDMVTWVDDVMQGCFQLDCYRRPTFAHLADYFRDLLFDPSLDAIDTMSKYVCRKPAVFPHKLKRDKMYETAKLFCK